jgi:hypothetical protein
MVFLNPETKQWETEDQYLSGNVREKLVAADSASVAEVRFRENVEALKSVQPADLPATEIDVRLGASWLPPSDVQDFVHGLLGVASGVEVGHIHALGSWHVTADWEAKGATANTTDQIWEATKDDRLAQLVFCDLSTPQDRGFSVYRDAADKLKRLGVPENEIAFIQDYDADNAKLALFRSVRAGKVRVLFGSTQKMGSGTNVQERLIALHHLDAPWRPADVEQREGRILRQGNKNASVQIYRYVTEGSFDAYMWQTLETKAKFISQVMSGDMTIRRLEDMDSAALTYAEVKAIASGNPLVIEKAQVDAELIRLTGCAPLTPRNNTASAPACVIHARRCRLGRNGSQICARI